MAGSTVPARPASIFAAPAPLPSDPYIRVLARVELRRADGAALSILLAATAPAPMPPARGRVIDITDYQAGDLLDVVA